MTRLDQPCDLVVGYRDRNYLIEVKQIGSPVRCGSGLTASQKRWHDQWRGQVNVVTTAIQALMVIGADARVPHGEDCRT